MNVIVCFSIGHPDPLTKSCVFLACGLRSGQISLLSLPAPCNALRNDLIVEDTKSDDLLQDIAEFAGFISPFDALSDISYNVDKQQSSEVYIMILSGLNRLIFTGLNTLFVQ